jgi:hypothetical protein
MERSGQVYSPFCDPEHLQEARKKFTTMVSTSGKYTNIIHPILGKISSDPEQYKKNILNLTIANKKIQEQARQEKIIAQQEAIKKA